MTTIIRQKFKRQRPKQLASTFGEARAIDVADRFTREAALHFAERLRREAGEDSAKQIEHAFYLAFTRAPTATECAAARQFIEAQSAARKGDGALALVDFCHALLNANELIYPD